VQHREHLVARGQRLRRAVGGRDAHVAVTA
jgi:hypothetical protein